MLFNFFVTLIYVSKQQVNDLSQISRYHRPIQLRLYRLFQKVMKTDIFKSLVRETVCFMAFHVFLTNHNNSNNYFSFCTASIGRQKMIGDINQKSLFKNRILELTLIHCEMSKVLTPGYLQGSDLGPYSCNIDFYNFLTLPVP